MKKTILIATLALGLCSACAAESAITLPELAYTNTNISGALSVSDTFSGANNTFTMVAVYDYNTLLGSAVEHASSYSTKKTILTLTQGNGSTRDIVARSSNAKTNLVFGINYSSNYFGDGALTGYTEDKLVLLLSQDATTTTLYYLTPESGSTAATLTSLVSRTGAAGDSFTSLSSLDGYGLEALYVYKGAMNKENERLAAATAAYTAAVPEPATATLSLLALAGIAARRRRK